MSDQEALEIRLTRLEERITHLEEATVPIVKLMPALLRLCIVSGSAGQKAMAEMGAVVNSAGGAGGIQFYRIRDAIQSAVADLATAAQALKNDP